MADIFADKPAAWFRSLSGRAAILEAVSEARAKARRERLRGDGLLAHALECHAANLAVMAK